MKKLLLTILMGMLVSVTAFSTTADLFSYDADQLNHEMEQLQSLENYVLVNPGITLTNLQSESNALVNDLNLTSGEFGGIGGMSGESALGIPSFLWGCVLGWVGILVVHLVTEDSEETRKAMWGCIVGWVGGTIVGVLFWVVYAFLIMGSYYYYY